MSTLTYAHKPLLIRGVVIKKYGNVFGKFRPRRCMLVSTGLILAGLSVPVLMVVGWVPVTYLAGFIGLALAAAGSMVWLVKCGDI